VAPHITGTAHPSGPASRARGFAAARIIHPFPTFLNVAATIGLAFVAADGPPPWPLTARLAAAMFCAQACIGITNDIFDRRLDAATKPWKPIPRGLISVDLAAWIAGGFLGASLALGATVSGLSMALLALGASCGLAYDVGLKRTVFSAVPFMIAIPTLPAWVFVSLDRWQPELWLLLPLGSLLGLSIHLANTIPDVDADAEQGVRGLAHRLGVPQSMRLAWCSFAAALALSLVLWPALSYDARWYLPALCVGFGCMAAIALASRSASPAALRLNFGVTSIGSVILAVGWLNAVA